MYLNNAYYFTLKINFKIEAANKLLPPSKNTSQNNTAIHLFQDNHAGASDNKLQKEKH